MVAKGQETGRNGELQNFSLERWNFSLFTSKIPWQDFTGRYTDSSKEQAVPIHCKNCFKEQEEKTSLYEAITSLTPKRKYLISILYLYFLYNFCDFVFVCFFLLSFFFFFLTLYFWNSKLYSRFLIFAFMYLLPILYL